MKRTLAYNETPRFNEYRKLRHAEHLSKHELCPETPDRTCPERGRGVTCDGTRCLFIRTHDELRTGSNPHVMGDDDEDGVALKKRKVVDGLVANGHRVVDPTLHLRLRAGTHFVLFSYSCTYNNGLACFLE